MASTEFTHLALVNQVTAALPAECLAQTPHVAAATKTARSALSAANSYTPPYPGILTDLENLARFAGRAVVSTTTNGRNDAAVARQSWTPPGFEGSPFPRDFRQSRHESAGIEPDDVIFKVDNTPVSTLARFRE